MKGNRNPHPPSSSAAPISPNSKGTAKYTNKDGSKFITVPKMNTPVDSAHPSPTVASPSPAAQAATQPIPDDEPARPVNRKKQKRRAKAAAKLAAEQAQNAPATNGIPSPPRTNDQQSADADLEDDEDEPSASLGPQDQRHYQEGAAQPTPSGASKKQKKKKKKNASAAQGDEFPNDNQYAQNGQNHHPASVPPPPPPPPMAGSQQDRPGMSREKIWNTNSQEERERIKEFWLGLSETERKSLVKVEKDAVLKKMKEQQKHTCSCTVCGRKRTAIEEELEGLYDAYYEELEQYANQPNQGDGPPMLRPRRSFGPMGGMRPRGLHSRFSNHQPSRGRIMDELGDDDELEEEEEDEEEEEEEAEMEDEGEGEEEGEDIYSEDELEDDMYSDAEQEPSEELHRSDYAADFFNFGNSLTVQGMDRLSILSSFLHSYLASGAGNNAYGSSSLGGILTVADDLLKNDGKKFIEMMEQLAERRMAREEDARGQFDQGYDHPNGNRYAHTHPPPPDEEDYEDEEEDYEEDEEEEYDSQDEEAGSLDPMTEEQRMEEGRRMFQIFAARMFEQRVLTAYREKVARERQAKLLEEIEAENQQDVQRKAKKARDAQRRKDRLAKKKEVQAEEKARKEAEKAAEEAARKAEEDRKAEEQRARAEEKRKKKEAQRKAEEEERQRKEAERIRKIQAREENERKAREAREREKKAREEARLKEKAAREQRERKDRERKEQQERERKEKETRVKAEREAQEAREREAKAAKETKEKAAREAKEAKEAKEKRRKEERAAHKAATLAAAVPAPVTLPKRPAGQQQQQQQQQPAAQPQAAAVPALPQQSTSVASPQISVATPALPKAPTPMRTRQLSQQDESVVSAGAASNSGSAASQNHSPHPVTPVHVSPGAIGPLGKSGPPAAPGSQSSIQQPPHSASPVSFPARSLPPPPNAFGLPPPGTVMSFPPGLSQGPPGFGSNAIHREPTFPPMPGFRPMPGMMPMPPGFAGPTPNRGFPMHPPPGFHSGAMESPGPSMAQVMSPTLQKESTSPHSRQGSGSFDASVSQPVGRPAPIGRPGSVVQGQRPSSGSPSGGPPKPEPEAHLGSRALLDDLDDAPQEFSGRLSRGGSAPGPRPVPGFPISPFGMDPMFSHNPWGPPGPVQPNPFAPLPPPGFGHSPLGVHPPVNLPWGHPMPPASTFGAPGVVDRPIEPRSVAVRKMLRRACEDLSNANANANTDSSNNPPNSTDSFIPLDRIKTQVEMLNHGLPVDVKELLDICETEGNEVNGGGSFDVRDEPQTDGKSIRFVPGNERPMAQPAQLAVGYHPGSPIGASDDGPSQ
ncbi:salt tolerance down-regulator-domain-containing protein [Dichotomopilus funicola]|uniref:Stress response protein NST1 n=1 Tax=Dichotomopilus funicola TaxID=1934379 RepID=A0AAN6ZPY6_9PEZI|nr:salt tolerance down-regulator-domain-containing protein [Dichotomopilus funicola]